MVAASFPPSDRTGAARSLGSIPSLDALVGAHPDALRDFYARGRPCDAASLGEARGRLLALEALAPAHAGTRPLVEAVARHLTPWRGKSFERSGFGGTNRVLGVGIVRFRCDVTASALDALPTLVVRYDGLGNPWPAGRLVEELREVGPGVAIGPLFWRGSDERLTPILWSGLATPS